MSLVTYGLSGLLVTNGLGAAVYTFTIGPPRVEAGSSVQMITTIIHSVEHKDPANFVLQDLTSLKDAVAYATALIDRGAATREQVDHAFSALESLGYSSVSGELMDQLSSVREAMESHSHVST